MCLKPQSIVGNVKAHPLNIFIGRMTPQMFIYYYDNMIRPATFRVTNPN